MSLSGFNTFLSLVFPPLFILGITFFEFKTVVLVFTAFMFFYMILSLVLKQSLKEISTPIIYFSFLLIAYLVSSLALVKLIPALISGSFFLFFLNAYIQKQQMILKFANKFSPKLIDKPTQEYIGKSDGYWAIALFINTLIQIALVFYDNNELWAFYSSVGWYIYLFFVFVLHFLYGKFYILKNKEVL